MRKAALGMVCAVLTLATLAPATAQDTTPDDTADGTPPALAPGIGSGLRTDGNRSMLNGALDALVRSESAEGARSQSAAPSPMVEVELLHAAGDTGFDGAIVAAGGVILGRSPELTLVRVPVSALPDLEARDDIGYVRPPQAVDVLNILNGFPAAQGASPVALEDGGHVEHINADAWHAEGFTGHGIKIGIVDAFHGPGWTAAQNAGELPAPAGTISCIEGVCNTTEFPDSFVHHGNAVAETIHELVPDAQLYLATAATTADLQHVVDYFDSKGVEIISRSLGALLDGPGDGTGALNAVAADAVSKGMLWLNSAGNAAARNGDVEGTYWRGPFIDANANQLHDFDDGSDSMPFNSCSLWMGLRWNDWGNDRTDYDLYVYDTPGDLSIDNPEAALLADQQAGAPPVETDFTYAVAGDTICDTPPFDVDYLLIHVYDSGNGTGNDTLEMMMNNGAFLEWSNPYSAVQPISDSAIPGVISVGALEPFGTGMVANYSSEGPTNDGRIKPDITAVSCLAVLSADQGGYGCQTPGVVGFNGTSAAAPVVAGAAALVLGSGLATTPAGLESWLIDNATVNRGPAGPDNLYGHGELILPTPPSGGGDDGGGDGSTPSFVDTADSVFATDIVWLAVTGITKGCNPPANDMFCPGEPVTRGQMAAFMVRALGLTATDDTDFIDDDDSVFEADIEKLAHAGITKGCNPPANDMFCPGEPVTRGQMAAFMHRADELIDAVRLQNGLPPLAT